MDPQMQYAMDTRHLRHAQLTARAEAAKLAGEARRAGNEKVVTPRRSWLERLVTSLGSNYGAQEPYWTMYGSETS